MRIHQSLAAIAALALSLSGGLASATSTHEVVKMTPIKKDGNVVGAKFTVLLKPDGHTSARVGLGYARKNTNEHSPIPYVHVKDPAKGYMAAPLETVSVNGPTEKEMTVTYGAGNTLKSGDEVEVYSFWNESHLWGLNRHVTIQNEPIFKLP